jgi:hypothetical protein
MARRQPAPQPDEPRAPDRLTMTATDVHASAGGPSRKAATPGERPTPPLHRALNVLTARSGAGHVRNGT